MPMTKAEKAEMDNLRAARDMARALRWPEYAEPAPIPREEIRAFVGHSCDDRKVMQGWFANHHYGALTLGCSNGINHNRQGTERLSTQGPGTMYRTKMDALRVIRLAMTTEFARKLAKIDAEIAAEAARLPSATDTEEQSHG